MNPSLVIILAALACGVSSNPTPLGALDGIVEKLLNDIRPQLVDLVLPDINANLNSSGINAHLTTLNITTNRLDNFTIVDLKTTLLPIKLNLLTLNWDEITLFGGYGLQGTFDIDGLQGPVEINADGNALINVRNVTLNVGATFSSSGGHLQIKQVTLLTASLSGSTVKLDHLLGDSDLDLVVNVFLGFFLTEFVHDFGNDVLKAVEPTLIEEINKILAEIDFP